MATIPPLSIKRQYMDTAHITEGFTIRKGDNEVSVNAKAIALAGGVEAMTRRIVGVWLSMPEHYRSVGLSWYDDGHEFAVELAKVYDLTVWQVAQVIAVLSPQNPWAGKFDKDGKQWADGNRLCTIKVIKAWFEGGSELVLAMVGSRDKGGQGWGYTRYFQGKAIKVLSGEELDWTQAPKTHRFALLLANPKRTDLCVCDSHASRIATGNLGNRYHVVAASAYPLIEDAYMQAGIILDLPAYVIQAGTWEYTQEGNLYGTGE
jgi:hypothetical protein